MYEWLTGKIAEWLYNILVRHIEKVWQRRHRKSTWLGLAQRISKRYEDNDYEI